MKIFDCFKKCAGINLPQTNTPPDNLRSFEELDGEFYTKSEYGWQRADLGEGMAVLARLVVDYWKPRYLLDTRAHKAYEFMSADLKLLTVRDEDIDWNSLLSLSSDSIAKIRRREAIYPTMIRGFRGGKAELEWQINPDGRYYMDEDGFGMTDDEEVTLLGTIDRTGHVVEKLHYRP